jgi:hypothetical protein
MPVAFPRHVVHTVISNFYCMQKTFWIIGAVLVLVVGSGFLMFYAAQKPVAEAGDSLPQTPGQPAVRYMDIESYVRNNIGELSPVKEQVGGTFFVTAIETQGGTGTVSYEDGHNVYTADFAYTVEDSGKPSVTSFTVRGQ